MFSGYDFKKIIRFYFVISNYVLENSSSNSPLSIYLNY